MRVLLGGAGSGPVGSWSWLGVVIRQPGDSVLLAAVGSQEPEGRQAGCGRDEGSDLPWQ